MTSPTLPHHAGSKAQPGRETLRIPRKTPRTLAQRLVWPVYVCVILLAMIWGDAQDFRDPLRGILAISTIALVSVFEQWIPLDPTQALEPDRHTLHDFGHLFANTTSGIAQAAIALGAGWLVSGVFTQGLDVEIWPRESPWIVQCMLALVAADFLGYWVHRLEHRLPAMWAYHAIHHDIERLHVLRGTREHFATNLVRGLLIFAPLLCLGASIESLFVYQTLLITQGSIAHANLRLQLPDGLHRWILTPPGHRLHHARDEALSHCNFAAITPIYDRLFGTWADPTRRDAPAVGIERKEVPATFLGQLAHPFRVWLGLR